MPGVVVEVAPQERFPPASPLMGWASGQGIGFAMAEGGERGASPTKVSPD